jgi:hypothetical protein
LPWLYYTKTEADEKKEKGKAKKKPTKLILRPAEMVISGFAGEAYHSLRCSAISNQPAASFTSCQAVNNESATSKCILEFHPK